MICFRKQTPFAAKEMRKHMCGTKNVRGSGWEYQESGGYFLPINRTTCDPGYLKTTHWATKYVPILHPCSLYACVVNCKLFFMSSRVKSSLRGSEGRSIFLMVTSWHFEIIFMELWHQTSHSLFDEFQPGARSSTCTDESSSPRCVSPAARSQLLLLRTSCPVPIR